MWKGMAKQAKPSQTETGANVLAPVLHITLHFISAALLGSLALGSICKQTRGRVGVGRAESIDFWTCPFECVCMSGISCCIWQLWVKTGHREAVVWNCKENITIVRFKKSPVAYHLNDLHKMTWKWSGEVKLFECMASCPSKASVLSPVLSAPLSVPRHHRQY